MDANLDTIAKDLYGKIQTRFPDIRIGDEEANVLSKKQDIPKARFFEFEYKEDGDEIGTISVTLDADEGVVLEVSGDIVSQKHPGAFKFIRSFRQFAKDRLLNYDVKRMGKSNLDKRDYAFRSKVKDDMIMENKLFGTSKMSYQDLGEARLIIKHSQQINPELAAGRTMHIENIYIENAMGERFRYPVKHLNGARALAEHIKAGGHPYDGIGQHITGLSEELASLRKFKNYVGRQAQLSEAMGDITGKVMERIESVKKEIHSLQRPTYYQQFAESFVAHEEQTIPETVMDDWIDRLTIRTFNEELKSVFPYIFKLIDESELPVRELNPDDLLGEDGIEESSVNFDEDEVEQLLRQFDENMNERGGYGDPDYRKIFHALRIGDVEAAVEEIWNSYSDQDGGEIRMDDAIEDLEANLKHIIHRSVGMRELDEETLPWETDDEAKEREGGKKEKSPFKKPHNPNRTGRDAAKALAQKGIPKKEGFDPEQAFENFMNRILPEDGAASAALAGIFDPKQRPGAVAELNDIFKTELKGGPDGMNLNKVKELIPDPEFASMLDHLSGSGDLDLRSGIEVILNQMSEHNKDLADLIQSGELQFSSPEGSDMPVGGQDMPPPDAEAPSAEAPPAEPTAPVAPEAPPVEPTAPQVAESMGMSKLKAKLIKAVECGAGPDTQLDFGSRKMSLMSALKECGIDPVSIGMKSHSSGDGVQEILKSISGFWNRDATITEGNFTKGGTWTKQHVVSNFKNGEYDHATKEDVGRVLAMIEKMDPSSDAGGLNRMKQMAGIGGQHMHGIDEDAVDDDFAQLIKDFQEKHADADINDLITRYKKDLDITSQISSGPATFNAAKDSQAANDSMPNKGLPDGQSTSSTDSSYTKNDRKMNDVDGMPQTSVPTNGADSMAKFRDIAKGMKLKLPGMDGQDGPDLDFSDPSKMGSQIQSHVGNMMKGMQGKMPQGKMELPGGMGNLDPNAMMQQIMSKMPKQGMTQSNTSSGTVDGKPASFDDAMGKFKGMGGSMNPQDMMSQMPGGQKMDFKPADQANLLQVDNPEYVARRAAALKKPGAVVGQTTMESNNELASWLKIAGIK